ncbi:lytic transglycosylase domain-containing protein [Microbacterium sp. 4R-513]|uniref:aggregation-promoting factor C-terminal-like domain-containing protein n=1 Tax=Microbacterium sp. 4R-513 TaxID=2567934 RepID=UPI001F49EA33|nr:lytic transglycosylase domain-containing protein [Microbacterium sp. 4R-513]
MVGFAGAVPVSYAEASGSAVAFVPASYTEQAPTAAKTTVSGADEATSTAQEAVTAAAAAVTAAQAITSDIAASGLNVGVADTTVETADLEQAADRLETGIDHLPDALLPDVTDNVTDLVTATNNEVASLRGSLDAAIAAEAQRQAEEKARQEAEAKAKAEAEAKAAAAAAAPKSTSSGSSSRSGSYPTAPIPSGNGNGDNSPAGAQAFAHSQFASRGWGDDQFGCLVALWNKESGWNYQAYNRGSGAYGIPQALPGSKMGSAGADWQTNAATQVLWGLGYVQGRYGTPCGAWSHSQSTGWY